MLIVPSGVTTRTRALPVSAMYMFPVASNVMAAGVFKTANVAGPPSPPRPGKPLPATTVVCCMELTHFT